ncbi:unnamed protein product [Rotaria sp. Silwood1]|nr:unnamed protein product [Rotaria sp. Silwood1]
MECKIVFSSSKKGTNYQATEETSNSSSSFIADKTRSAHGVAIFLNKQAATAWKTLGSTWEAVNERIVMVRLACKPINVTVIAIYAPINPKNQQQVSSTTDPFYADLQATIKKVPKSDMLLIIGDFNARVGQEQHRTSSNVSYCLLRNLAKKKIEARQVEYWDELSIEIENAIQQHDPATAYAMVRRLRGGRAKIENLPIFDKQGCLLTNSNKRLSRWKDYFNDLLNVPSIVDQATIQQIPSATITVSEQERQDQTPTLNEVQCAIKQMKNGKVPGSDGISIDVIKAGGLPLAKCKQVENKLGMDLNGDGMIGSGSGHGASGGYRSQGQGGGGFINQAESITHMDLNGDGTVGGRSVHPSNPNQYGGVECAPNAHQSSGGGLMNQLENVTHMDLNRDGRVGGGSTQPSNCSYQGHKY